MARTHFSGPRLGFLGWTALLFALAVQAESEWSLAVALGWHPIVAAGIPGALGTYAIRALHAGREIVLCVSAMIATVSASRLLHAGMIPLTPWLVIAVSAIPALVMWRVHALGRGRPAADAHAADVTTPAEQPVTGPSAMPRILVTPAPRPAANAAPVTPPMPEQPPAVSAPVTPAEQPDADDPFGDDTAARLVASLYREYQREPVTHEIRDTLKYNGLPHSDGSCRGARIRAKKAMPELAAYPTRLTVTA